MKNELMFFMPMDPPTSTAQMHKIGIAKNGKPYVYDPPAVNKAKSKLMAGLIPNVPKEPITEACRLEVSWQFRADEKHKSGSYRDTKPDTDNLQKLLKDSMTALHFWKDDCLVCDEHVEKRYAEIPGILIRLEAIT